MSTTRGGRGRPRLTAAEVADVIARYKHGETQQQIADYYGVSRAAVWWQLHRQGITREDKPIRAHQADADDLARLVAAVYPGSWVDDALCAQVDSEIFFPEQGGSTRQARQTCLRCPVRAECLDYALANHEAFGVWGGLSERERRRVANEQPLPDRTKTCPTCGSEFPVDRGTRIYCTRRCQEEAKRRRSQQRTQHRRTA